MCFQHFNLFPHLTILENCTLGPDLGAQNAQEGSRRNGDAFPGEGENP